MPTLFITGANRGIGAEFVRQYAADGWRVIATVRNPSDPGEIGDIGGVELRQLDLSDDFFEIDWEGIAGREPVDMFINNAGVMGPTTVDSVDDAADFINTLAVNSVAPVLLARRLLPNVAAARGKLVAISSKMGSIEDNSSGGYIAYRASKAALNAAWRSLAVECKPQGVAAAVLHPGWVQTRMGGANAPVTPRDSVAGMRRVIEELDLTGTGGFYNYDGATIPW